MSGEKQNPLYLQIVDRVFDDVLKGKFIPNERIVSMRELSEKLQVNVNTVMKAYDLLRYQGIVYKKRGMGYCLSLNAVDLISKIRRQKFVEEQLPNLFYQMFLLKIDFTTIEEEYKKFNSVTF